MNSVFRNRDFPLVLRGLLQQREDALRSLREVMMCSQSILSSLTEKMDRHVIESIERRLQEIDMNILELIQRDHLSHLESFFNTFQRFHPLPERTVFVMMKFPSGGGKMKEDQTLDAIYRRIQKICNEYYALTAVRADELNAAQTIWDNAQVHALGSGYGIAVIENKHSDEFNPNIAMEAGYMTALGRDVLLLVEKEFPYNRADIAGRIRSPFTWGDKESELKTIDVAIMSWLDNLRVQRRPGSARP